MYKKINPLPADYSEWAKTGNVYKCKKDIECKDGIFTKGSCVMLNVCSAEKGEIYIIDFASVLEKKVFYITNNMTDINVKHDKASLLPNQLGDCFDEVKGLSRKINNHNKYINRSGFIGLAIMAVSMIIFMITIFVSGFEAAANSSLIFVAVANLITVIGVLGFNLAKSVTFSEELRDIIYIIEKNEKNRDNVSP